MKNFLTISSKPSTNRLDISNIFTVAALFRENIIVSEDEWDKWGPKNGAFCPFEPLYNHQFNDWISDNFPDGLPTTLPADFEGCDNGQNIRWMPVCDYHYYSGNYTALMSAPQYVTNWRLMLVHECHEKHQLFLWDPQYKFWAEFCLKPSMYFPEYSPEEQAIIHLLHAWMDW